MQKLINRQLNRDYVKLKDKINPSPEYIQEMKNSVIAATQIKMQSLANAHSMLEKVIKDAEKIKSRWN